LSLPGAGSREEGDWELIANIEGKTAAAPANALIKPSAAVKNGVMETMVEMIRDSLDSSKAEDITVIDLAGKTSLADYMVIATGRSDRHVGAIAEHLIQRLKSDGHGTPRVEGMPHCDWVLVDANDVIVHVFRNEVRQFYNLEKMWGGDRPAERVQAS
jgi:ribosome-associated protein